MWSGTIQRVSEVDWTDADCADLGAYLISKRLNHVTERCGDGGTRWEFDACPTHRLRHTANQS